ncbi:alpha-L-Rha alpha-1%2C3-L-rhamnosyltransferase [Yersinia frederiksenii]|nr:alpha-L-Rha alpha-1%2C3-L-rhamnosyltransferase [Yersinia frederiksenii]CNC79430.1 alpha-L-Rha alpha-1%2C3-L-rhamnosyltransferase [Yersinia frederiksenii]CNI37384.1 alpha-L-Rha alpha-1%2C3-L-rhamnosyltransferase [Yersinia frederiksenii]
MVDLGVVHLSKNKNPSIAILMGTYNAEKFLEQQLKSIENQSVKNWSLWVSDDGSRDATLAILERYQRKWKPGQLNILSGPQRGFAQNFMSLVCNIEIIADYFSFSDQDDIWEEDKLERALNALSVVPLNQPSLYCSRTRLVDEMNIEIGFSPLCLKSAGFRNALVQSLGGGNTMLFNDTSRKLLLQAGSVDVVSHDWWVYIAVSACGGAIIYDSYPSLRYRQHQYNLVGTNTGCRQKLIRLKRLWKGEFQSWIDRNISALNLLNKNITLISKQRLEVFSAARRAPLLIRLFGLKKSGIYRQNFLGNLGLIFAALFGKL